MVTGNIVAELGASTAIGAGLGAFLRLAPEALRFLTKVIEQNHEYRMTELSIESAKVAVPVETVQLETAGLGALMDVVKLQAKPTGVKWVDAVSATVRPAVTYWWLAVYTAAKIVTLRHGLEPWTEFDQATLGAILNFWFLDRVLTKRPI